LTHWKPVLETECFNEGPAALRYPPYGKDRVKEMLEALGGGKWLESYLFIKLWCGLIWVLFEYF